MAPASSSTSESSRRYREEPPPLTTRVSLAGALQLAYRCANSSGMLSLKPVEWSYLRLYFLYKRFLEDPYARLMGTRPELFRGGHILDVGANVGYDTVLFAKALSPGARVVALEPERENFRRLQAVVGGSASAERITVHRLAAGAREGEASLAIHPSHAGGHRIAPPSYAGARQQVRMTSIDAFLAQHGLEGPVAFVKIDVQGYELEVSRGMAGLIDDTPDLVVGLELQPGTLREFGVSVEELLSFYADRSFQAFAIDPDGLHPIDAASLRAMPPEGYLDVILSRQVGAGPAFRPVA